MRGLSFKNFTAYFCKFKLSLFWKQQCGLHSWWIDNWLMSDVYYLLLNFVTNWWSKPYQTDITIKAKIGIHKIVYKKNKVLSGLRQWIYWTGCSQLLYGCYIYDWSISDPAWMRPNTRLSFWEMFVLSVFLGWCDNY